MNRTKLILAGLLLLAVPAIALAQPKPAAMAGEADSIYAIKVKPMEMDDKTSDTLAPYRGKVMLILNVASKCGNTPQYEGLEKLYRQYKDQGLVILGFPCNQFGGQEPGTEAQIVEFCKSTYDVDFPLYAKIEVNGPGRTPLYKHLIGAPGIDHGNITWNFEKFLVDRDGKVVARFTPKTKPDDPRLLAAVKKALAEKPDKSS